ncbi:phosphatidylglycerophosphate phosphatase 1, chloroplastic/mitochondrial isoform X2 [Cornus florida]|uniref:phosphatidylglycerophosphate phosphatase 1, chloroplastic/mitochondrial isoform X2 n=1 Tax=Cornus florida TaxID=4283 RepID=UPI00289848C0|nr:phosphatidylglycerophosphate phosphatase 1, chloroplastic/mitochondrial isoform X2 [Cornus florida]
MLQSNSCSSWHVACYHCPISAQIQVHYPHKFNNLLLPHKRTINASSSPSKRIHTHFTRNNNCFLTLTATNSCSKDQKKKKDSHPHQNHAFLEHLYSSTDTNKQTQFIRNQEAKEETSQEFHNREAISTNMWWADLKAALGQRINLEGIVSSVAVVARDRHLALPHISVPDISYIDWPELKAKGFQGVVFDKDNTITVPYSLTLWPPLRSSLERCKSVFGNEIAVFSNSAGLNEYDPDGWKARALEGAIGIQVIRHGVKKPAGTAEEIEKHFGFESSRLIMVGDRPFTDIVYGNRNGFLTVLTEPLSLAEEPFIVKQIRMMVHSKGVLFGFLQCKWGRFM